MTRSHLIDILMILTKYVFDVIVQLTEYSITVESVTLRFYCTSIYLIMLAPIFMHKFRKELITCSLFSGKIIRS